MPLRIGTLLYGYCGGAFGRDSYSNKRVEGIGADWVVARELEGHEDIVLANFSPEQLEEYSKENE